MNCHYKHTENLSQSKSLITRKIQDKLLGIAAVCYNPSIVSEILLLRLIKAGHSDRTGDKIEYVIVKTDWEKIVNIVGLWVISNFPKEVIGDFVNAFYCRIWMLIIKKTTQNDYSC